METQILKIKHQLLVITVTFTGMAFNSCAQENCYPTQLPQAALSNKTEYQYLVETDYISYDIYGNFTSKMRFSGTYTSGLEGGMVEWSNVHAANLYTEEAEFPYGDSLTFMNGFRYSYEQDITVPEFFSSFPPDAVNARNLVWDMAGMEYFGWGFNNVLQLNEPYKANEANGNVELAGLGNFENRNIVLNWKGMTEDQGNRLAIIDFRTMNNPLNIDVDMGNMHMVTKGRSHYWGTIWIDCDRICFDHIELFEDVVMEMTIGLSEKQLLDVVREMKVTKIY